MSVTAAWMKEERSRSAAAELGDVSSLGRPPLRYECLLIQWSSVPRFRATWGKFYRGRFPALLRPLRLAAVLQGSRQPSTGLMISLWPLTLVPRDFCFLGPPRK